MIIAHEIVGPYELIRRLGKGSFGEVWLAKKNGVIAAPQYAIKFHYDDEIDVEAIKREADLWVRASGHPFILPIVEATIYEKKFVLVSEYAEEGSLEDWLRLQNISLRVELIIEKMMNVLAGLEHLHHQQVVHRDLKPANILLQGGYPRLADFGLSRIMKSTKTSSGIAGTPAYMAPEAFNRNADSRNIQTDLWAVGVILYRMISGRLPFEDQNFYALMNVIANDPHVPLPEDCPRPLSEVVDKALRKAPGDRYSSATEMREQLKNVLLEIEWARNREAQDRSKDHSGDRARTVLLDAGGLVLEMILVDGGTFAMGALEGIGLANERPEHKVRLSPYYISKHPITQKQWKALMKSNPSHVSDDEHPVEQVSWDMATDFCQKLSSLAGVKFRLPTEAEWEVACRSGERLTALSYGGGVELDDIAWNAQNSEGQARPVGQKTPNSWGLYDMLGNVWEWCEDWYSSNYYENSPVENPTGPEHGEFKVIRGGSWSSSPLQCRPTCRYFSKPARQDENCGFRVVCVGSLR